MTVKKKWLSNVCDHKFMNITYVINAPPKMSDKISHTLEYDVCGHLFPKLFEDLYSQLVVTRSNAIKI